MAIFKMAGSATMNQLGEPDSETVFKHLIKSSNFLTYTMIPFSATTF